MIAMRILMAGLSLIVASMTIKLIIWAFDEIGLVDSDYFGRAATWTMMIIGTVVVAVSVLIMLISRVIGIGA